MYIMCSDLLDSNCLLFDLESLMHINVDMYLLRGMCLSCKSWNHMKFCDPLVLKCFWSGFASVMESKWMNMNGCYEAQIFQTPGVLVLGMDAAQTRPDTCQIDVWQLNTYF